jgi:methionine-S-sulfoxide reductase
MNKTLIVIATILLGTVLWYAVRANRAELTNSNAERYSGQYSSPQAAPPPGMEQATFGLGCFSCAEAMFEQLKGVESVDPGYSGGSAESATYERVSSGKSEHAEAVNINYDPKVISYDELLEVFWKMHDPTTKDRQGKDVGPHYRSAIFYHNDKQRELAEHYQEKLEASGAFPAPIVTEITQFKAFYPAEKEHLDFYRLNPEHQYCSSVIRPKMDEFKKVFSEKLRPSPGATSQKP